MLLVPSSGFEPDLLGPQPNVLTYNTNSAQLVLLVRIELTTYALPRRYSTPEL